jgi:hypothetical protein
MPTYVYFSQSIVYVGLMEIKAWMKSGKGGEEVASTDKKFLLDAL